MSFLCGVGLVGSSVTLLGTIDAIYFSGISVVDEISSIAKADAAEAAKRLQSLQRAEPIVRFVVIPIIIGSLGYCSYKLFQELKDHLKKASAKKPAPAEPAPEEKDKELSL